MSEADARPPGNEDDTDIEQEAASISSTLQQANGAATNGYLSIGIGGVTATEPVSYLDPEEEAGQAGANVAGAGPGDSSAIQLDRPSLDAVTLRQRLGQVQLGRAAGAASGWLQSAFAPVRRVMGRRGKDRERQPLLGSNE